MPVVVSLVIVVGAICLLDLVLTVGVIRRLREHSTLISELGGGRMPVPMLQDGETADAFEAVATTGEVVSRDGLSGNTLVGVFSPDCSACKERLPGFIRLARSFSGGRDRVVAVVAEMGGDTEFYRRELEPVARVVIEREGTGINKALHVKAFPAFGILGEAGKVVVSGLDPEQVVTPAAA
ncbi:TlpA family protein disulfide reductase [Thermostaphylospora chromogena]|uniref:Thiol-disulfide isomerase or thioredoxin n=1 Tax=Thermostaphylospora chromogena TaxID=35622 RepID=A0A1H1EFC4_9ACTN|nr:hypothetical protein [Thermostaphylospora chromogena]SDQ87270.1 Thiol-disulfide isomerase or thioredoxin [Thermostaphylospora chromogena]